MFYFMKSKTNTIPYITSYYKKDWGFCCAYKKYSKNNKFKVVIESSFKKVT